MDLDKEVWVTAIQAFTFLGFLVWSALVAFGSIWLYGAYSLTIHTTTPWWAQVLVAMEPQLMFAATAETVRALVLASR